MKTCEAMTAKEHMGCVCGFLPEDCSCVKKFRALEAELAEWKETAEVATDKMQEAEAELDKRQNEIHALFRDYELAASDRQVNIARAAKAEARIRELEDELARYVPRSKWSTREKRMKPTPPVKKAKVVSEDLDP